MGWASENERLPRQVRQRREARVSTSREGLQAESVPSHRPFQHRRPQPKLSAQIVDKPIDIEVRAFQKVTKLQDFFFGESLDQCL